MQKITLVLAAFAVVSAYGVQASETPIFDSPEAGTEHILSGLGEDTETCSGDASSSDTFCTTGLVDLAAPFDPVAGRQLFVPQHQRNGGVSHGFGGVTLTGVTATLESKLVHQGGARVFRCNVVNGAIGCFGGSGAFPAEGAVFAQECRSYALGTTNPGGVGTWACSITHPGG